MSGSNYWVNANGANTDNGFLGVTGNDSFFGGAGEDQMWGFGGNDTLMLGDGNEGAYPPRCITSFLAFRVVSFERSIGAHIAVHQVIATAAVHGVVAGIAFHGVIADAFVNDDDRPSPPHLT